MLEFLPQYMRQDITAQGIAYAITKVAEKIINKIENCSIYNRIEQLSETTLDELAWQFNVPEYIPTLDIVNKRAIISNCLKTHKQRGTVAAVEKVVADIFGNGNVKEWFEYGGEPYHFRIHTTNTTVNDDMVAEFEKLVASTQNIRSVLESVVLEAALEMNVYMGSHIQSVDIVHI